MLVPIENVVGTGYNAGLTATTFVQPDSYAGAGYTSPSGQRIGGQKLGVDMAARMLAHQGRYQRGPVAGANVGELGYVAKDRGVPYLTERDRLGSLGAPMCGDPGVFCQESPPVPGSLPFSGKTSDIDLAWSFKQLAVPIALLAGLWYFGRR